MLSRTCRVKKKRTAKLVSKVSGDNLVDSLQQLAHRFVDRRMTLIARCSWSSGERYYPLPAEGHFGDVTSSEKEAERSLEAVTQSSCGERRRNLFRTRAPNCCATRTTTAEKQRFNYLTATSKYSAVNYSLVFLQWLMHKATSNPRLTLQIDLPVKVLWGRKTSMKWKTINSPRGFSSSRLSAVIALTSFGE